MSCSSSPKKVTPRLCCSLVNALSSSRTACRLRLRSSPLCSLRRSSSPKKVTLRLCCSLINALATRRLATNFFRFQAVGCCALSFPLVGNAHLVVTDFVSLAAAFLADTLAPSFLLSSKSLARFGCSLINALTTPHCRYQLFAVSSGRVLCLISCRERTPGVPR